MLLTTMQAAVAHAAGPVKVHYQCERLENITQVLAALGAGSMDGRAELDLSL